MTVVCRNIEQSCASTNAYMQNAMKHVQDSTKRGRNSFQRLTDQVLANENQVLSRVVSRQTSKSGSHSKQERFFYFFSGWFDWLSSKHTSFLEKYISACMNIYFLIETPSHSKNINTDFCKRLRLILTLHTNYFWGGIWHCNEFHSVWTGQTPPTHSKKHLDHQLILSERELELVISQVD